MLRRPAGLGLSRTAAGAGRRPDADPAVDKSHRMTGEAGPPGGRRADWRGSRNRHCSERPAGICPEFPGAAFPLARKVYEGGSCGR